MQKKKIGMGCKYFIIKMDQFVLSAVTETVSLMELIKHILKTDSQSKKKGLKVTKAYMTKCFMKMEQPVCTLNKWMERKSVNFIIGQVNQKIVMKIKNGTNNNQWFINEL